MATLETEKTPTAPDDDNAHRALPDKQTVEAAGELLIKDEKGTEIPFKSLYSDKPADERQLIIFVRHFFCGVSTKPPQNQLSRQKEKRRRRRKKGRRMNASRCTSLTRHHDHHSPANSTPKPSSATSPPRRSQQPTRPSPSSAAATPSASKTGANEPVHPTPSTRTQNGKCTVH